MSYKKGATVITKIDRPGGIVFLVTFDVGLFLKIFKHKSKIITDKFLSKLVSCDISIFMNLNFLLNCSDVKLT